MNYCRSDNPGLPNEAYLSMETTYPGLKGLPEIAAARISVGSRGVWRCTALAQRAHSPCAASQGAMCGTSPFGLVSEYSIPLEALSKLAGFPGTNDGMVGLTSCQVHALSGSYKDAFYEAGASRWWHWQPADRAFAAPPPASGRAVPCILMIVMALDPCASCLPPCVHHPLHQPSTTWTPPVATGTATLTTPPGNPCNGTPCARESGSRRSTVMCSMPCASGTAVVSCMYYIVLDAAAPVAGVVPCPGVKLPRVAAKPSRRRAQHAAALRLLCATALSQRVAFEENCRRVVH